MRSGHFRWSLTLATAAVLMASSMSSAGVLDQSNAGPNQFNGVFVQDGQSLVQTFTVGISGLLDEVDLQLGRLGNPTHDLNFEIFQTANASSSVAIEADLVSLSLSSSLFSTSTALFTAIDLASLGAVPFAVTAGEVLAIRLSSSEPAGSGQSYALNTTATDTYTRGNLFYVPPGVDNVAPGDAGFRTYVAPASDSSFYLPPGVVGIGGGFPSAHVTPFGAIPVPEPATFGIAALGGVIALLGLRRRAR